MPLRNEKEKMLAGESYNCLDPDLEAIRQKAKKLLRLYNQTESRTRTPGHPPATVRTNRPEFDH